MPGTRQGKFTLPSEQTFLQKRPLKTLSMSEVMCPEAERFGRFNILQAVVDEKNWIGA